MNTIEEKQFDTIRYWKLGSNRFGKPNMHVYCFLVDGLLIDTGQPLIKSDLLNALAPHPIDHIIVTHHHEDHSGNIEAIKEAKAIPAFASKKCCKIMQNPPRVEPARWMTWGQMPNAHLKELSLDAPFCTNNHEFTVISTPGHAIDQISLYEPTKGWLFSGDLYVHDYIKVFMKEEDIGQQIDSLKRLIQLDFDVLWCNHQPILKGGKQRLKNKLQFLEDFYGTVANAYQKGMSVPQLMKILGLKDKLLMKWISLGQLSRSNMVRSVIKNI